MALITTKNIGTSAKQAVLTNTELDNNFININDELGTKVDSSAVEYPSSIVDLHRSPNAVTAMFIYDTSKDSDGGAWTDRCQGTSWYNETLSGNWLGAHTTETGARFYRATLGIELLLNTTFTNTDNWIAGPGATLSASNNKLTVTGSTGVIVYQGFPTEIGSTYLISGKMSGGTSAQLAIATATSSGTIIGTTGTVTYVANTEYKAFFVATGTTSYFRLVTVTGNNSFAEVSCRKVNTLYAQANDYFQLISNGKFYSLSKNLLTTTATLATQTQWLTAGTYTLSSTTGSSGSVVLSGAATGTHTAGTPLTFTVTTSGLVTFTVSGSVLTAQCELGSVGTTYSANTSTTRYNEVYRGNKREFPKLSAIVAESQSITIYDLTEPNRPMWMRFPPTILFGGISAVNSSIYMLNGYLMVAGSVYFHLLNFIKDIAEQIGTNPNKTYIIGISNRTATTLNGIPYYYQTNSAAVMTSASCNAISACILPNAPIDPVTGLKIPTIALATGGGISVIKHDGTVVNSASTANMGKVTITPTIMSYYIVSAQTWYLVYNPGSLSNSFGSSTSGIYDYGNGVWNGLINYKRNSYLKMITSSSIVKLCNHHEQNISKSMIANISNGYNTGYQIGDIRRTYMSSVISGSTSATELVTNGTFDADTAGWTATINSILSIENNRLKLTNEVAAQSYAYQIIPTIIGKTYKCSVDITTIGTSYLARCYIGTSMASNTLCNFNGIAESTITRTGVFDATSTTTYITLLTNNLTLGAYAIFDNISVKEVIADRSYKSGKASISGTLTKSSNTGTDLQWYSGFSNSNYAREHINPDLVFSSAGPTEWHLSSWMKIPTSLPTGNFPIQTPNLLSNGTFTDSTGWSVSTGITISGGTLNFNTVTNTYAHYNSIISQIKPYYSYQVTVDIVSWVRGIPFMGLRGGALPIIDILTTPGTHTFTLVSGASNIYGLLIYGGSSGSGGECVMDNLIIQEIGPAILIENHIDDQLYDTNYYWDSDIVWE